MKTVYHTAASLDGFLADADHGLDWLFQFETDGDAALADVARFQEGAGAVAMGASTYEWLLRHQVHADPDASAPWPYAQPVWVFTHRDLRPVPGADVRFVQGDVRPVHAAMSEASAGKDLWLVGGGDLVGQFYDAGLLDEIVVTVASVTLGRGMPLLPRRIVTPPLVLVGVGRYGASFAQLTYRVARP